MKNFRSFQLAVTFYKQCQSIILPRHLRDQLLRASSSIALNLAEARGKATLKDQLKYFHIALGSVRECEAILILHGKANKEMTDTLDHLAASVYKLIKNAR